MQDHRSELDYETKILTLIFCWGVDAEEKPEVTEEFTLSNAATPPIAKAIKGSNPSFRQVYTNRQIFIHLFRSLIPRYILGGCPLSTLPTTSSLLFQSPT